MKGARLDQTCGRILAGAERFNSTRRSWRSSRIAAGQSVKSFAEHRVLQTVGDGARDDGSKVCDVIGLQCRGVGSVSPTGEKRKAPLVVPVPGDNLNTTRRFEKSILTKSMPQTLT
jgi:hypothetical protein